jgi:hypothetical protein
VNTEPLNKVTGANGHPAAKFRSHGHYYAGAGNQKNR